VWQDISGRPHRSHQGRQLRNNRRAVTSDDSFQGVTASHGDRRFFQARTHRRAPGEGFEAGGNVAVLDEPTMIWISKRCAPRDHWWHSRAARLSSHDRCSFDRAHTYLAFEGDSQVHWFEGLSGVMLRITRNSSLIFRTSAPNTLQALTGETHHYIPPRQTNCTANIRALPSPALSVKR